MSVGRSMTLKPAGLFDRSLEGTAMPPVTVEIERDRIRLFAKVLGIADPVHYDVDAARGAGLPDLLAPPSFFTVLEACAEQERERRGVPGALDRLGCDFRYLLHGSETYRYHGPLFARDTVAFSTMFKGFEEKKGGLLEIAHLQMEVSHSRRGLIIEASRSLIHRFG